MPRLTTWVLAHRRIVVLAWIAVAVAGGWASATIADSLTKSFTAPGRPAFEANEEIVREYRSGGVVAPAVLVGQDEADLKRVAGAVQGARVALPGDPGGEALRAQDGRTLAALVFPPPGRAAPDENPEAIAALTKAAAGTGVRVTGIDALSEGGGGGGTGVLIETLAGGIGALVVLVSVFASVAALVPIGIAIVSILGSFLLLRGLAAITEISFVVQFIVALIGLGVAIDYSLLVIVRWREERERGLDGDEAILAAMRTAGRAVVFSGTTVAVGLLALVVVPVPGDPLDRLRRPADPARVRARVGDAAARPAAPRRRPPQLAGGPAGAVGGPPLARVVAMGGPAPLAGRRGRRRRARGPRGLRDGPEPGQPQGRRAGGQRRAAGSARRSRARRPGPRTADADRGAARRPRRRGPLPGRRGRAGRRGAGRSESASSRCSRARTPPRMRAPAPSTPCAPRPSGWAHGPAARRRRPRISPTRSTASFVPMLILIAFVTFVLLARAFRSVVLPLKAIALNVLSVGAAFGVIVIVWQQGHGAGLFGVDATGAITNWVPLAMFAFLFGLSMDYEVFILSRMRESYDEHGDTDRAVVDGLGATGRLVTSAALILFLAFVALGAAPGTEIKIFATGLAAGIIIDATIVRALIVPALVTLLGHVNWWLPSGLARLLRVPRG